MKREGIFVRLKKISRFFLNLKIQSKMILLFSSVFVISIVAVIYIFYVNWSNTLTKEVIDYSSLYLKQLNETIDKYFDDLERFTLMAQADSNLQKILRENLTNSSDIEMKSKSDYVENFMFNIYTLKPDITNIVLLSENGMLITEGIRKYSLFNQNPWEYKWYIGAASSRGKSMIFKNIANEDPLGQISDEPTISVARVITDNTNNDVLGCIRIDVAYNKVQKIIESVGMTASMEILVIAEDYSVIFDPENVIGQASIPRFAEAFEKILSMDSGSLRSSLGDGIRTIVFDNSEYTGWSTIGIISEEKLLQETREIRNLSFIILAVTVLIIIVFCVLIALGITKPLKKLSKSMNLVSGGYFDIKVDFEYNDEIGDIGRSFDMMTRRIKELVEREYVQEIKRQEVELKALMAQINPHFLYNTLEALRMKAVVNKDTDVAGMIKKLSQFLRMNIIGAKDIVEISEELNHVGYYIDIMNMRYNNRFELIIDIDDDIINALILKLTLQPLIENSIFHGFETKEGSCVIIIRGKKLGNDVLIEVIDNGTGMEEKTLYEIRDALDNATVTDKVGIGIVNVHKRLMYFFGKSYGIDIFSTLQKGTRIEIRIPYTIKSAGSEQND
jgi:two-component system sensor histidine kinase YesM